LFLDVDSSDPDQSPVKWKALNVTVADLDASHCLRGIACLPGE